MHTVEHGPSERNSKFSTVVGIIEQRPSSIQQSPDYTWTNLFASSVAYAFGGPTREKSRAEFVVSRGVPVEVTGAGVVDACTREIDRSSPGWPRFLDEGGLNRRKNTRDSKWFSKCTVSRWFVVNVPNKKRREVLEISIPRNSGSKIVIYLSVVVPILLFISVLSALPPSVLL